jgi:hypothetical protein
MNGTYRPLVFLYLAVIGLAVSLIVLLQSCAANFAGALGSQSLKQGAAVGMLLALFFIIGAGFAMRLPIVSIVVFAFGAIIAISAGHNSDFGDLQVWGWLSAILAVLSYFGHRERKRSLKPEVASNVPPIIKNQPAAATETMISSEMAHEKKPSPEMAAFMKPWSLAATGFVLGFIALIIVLFSQINLPTQSGSTAATTVTPAAAPMVQSFSGIRLSGSDLPKVVSTYRENEMRFKRDFLGKQFSDVLPFKSATENVFLKGSYLVGFGNNIISDVNCTVKSPTEISAIANWNKGDRIHIEGNVKDVTLGSVNLESCRLTR